MTATLFAGCGSTENQKEDNKDWSKEYDNFLENANVSDGFRISTTMEEEGVKGEVSIAVAGNKSHIVMDFDVTAIEMFVDDAYLYVVCKSNGETAYAKAPVEATEDLNGFVDIENPIDDLFKSATNTTYVKETKEDGITLDVIKAEIPWGEDGVRYYISEDGTAIGLYEGGTYTTNDGKEITYDSLSATTDVTLYINRNTQEIVKLEGCIDGTNAIYEIETCKSIDIPKEALEAEEATSEELGMIIVAALFAAMSQGTNIGQ